MLIEFKKLKKTRKEVLSFDEVMEDFKSENYYKI